MQRPPSWCSVGGGSLRRRRGEGLPTGSPWNALRGLCLPVPVLEEPRSGRPDTGWSLGSPAFSPCPPHGCLRGRVGFTLPWRPGWLPVHSLRREAVTVASPAPTSAPRSALGPGSSPAGCLSQRAVRRACRTLFLMNLLIPRATCSQAHSSLKP